MSSKKKPRSTSHDRAIGALNTARSEDEIRAVIALYLEDIGLDDLAHEFRQAVMRVRERE